MSAICKVCKEDTPDPAMDTFMVGACSDCAITYRRAHNLSECCSEQLHRRFRRSADEVVQCSGCGEEVE